ncbi:MAG: DUF5661 family protein [Candidatus Asgardarchaeia archaeon]
MNWYKQAKNLPGGLADKKKPSDFNQKELSRGEEIELEHTKDKELAKDIAMDHLEEFPTYYTELDKMEEKLEKKEAARGPRYPGQEQGDEHRPGSSVMTDIISDNEVVEGELVAKLKDLYVKKDWAGINEYTRLLKREGHSPNRINSMLTRAMHKVKL